MSLPERPITQLGESVKRVEPVAPKEEPVEPEPEVAADEKGDPIWSDEPSFVDQLIKYPSLCRMGAPRIDVFDLSIPADRDKLNELTADTIPSSAPKVQMMKLEHQAYRGKWSTLATYRRISYKKLLPKA